VAADFTAEGALIVVAPFMVMAGSMAASMAVATAGVVTAAENLNP
jgi:hypothetical protein